MGADREFHTGPKGCDTCRRLTGQYKTTLCDLGVDDDLDPITKTYFKQLMVISNTQETDKQCKDWLDRPKYSSADKRAPAST